MAICNLPAFGFLDSDDLASSYDAEMEFEGRDIWIKLNFDHKTIEPDLIEKMSHFIDNIRIYDMNNKNYLDTDFNEREGKTVKRYLAHHVAELPEDDLAALTDPRNKSTAPAAQLLKKLHLVSVSIYPQQNDSFAVFDYSLGEDITNYLIAINTDENGNLQFMAMES